MLGPASDPARPGHAMSGERCYGPLASLTCVLFLLQAGRRVVGSGRSQLPTLRDTVRLKVSSFLIARPGHTASLGIEQIKKHDHTIYPHFMHFRPCAFVSCHRRPSHAQCWDPHTLSPVRHPLAFGGRIAPTPVMMVPAKHGSLARSLVYNLLCYEDLGSQDIRLFLFCRTLFIPCVSYINFLLAVVA